MFLNTRVIASSTALVFSSIPSIVAHTLGSSAVLQCQNKILEATYSYPVKNDSIIFNISPDSLNVSSILPTQIQGQVYFPYSQSRSHETPMVLLISGKHPDCRTYVDIPDFGQFPADQGSLISPGQCPPNQTVVKSYRGFDYLGRSLAANGFMAVSIDPILLNNANGPKDDRTLNAARGRIVLRTIEKIRTWDQNAIESRNALGFDISGAADFSQIAVMGHSRGGAGVKMAYNFLMTPSRLPRREVYDWSTLRANITGVFEVAPFDALEEGAAVDAVGVPWALVGAGCETDEVDFGPLLSLPRIHRSVN